MQQHLIFTGAALLAACACLAPMSACALPDGAPRGDIAQVEIVDRETGERLPVYWHEGQRWISGTPGHRYGVYLRNASAARILGVVSVDGVNAVTGETADWGQRGYVLAPAQDFEVLGWRKSRQHVADFVFSAVDDAYAARTGRPDNVGVIGVAWFREAAAPALPIPPAPLLDQGAAAGPARPLARGLTAVPAPAAPAAGKSAAAATSPANEALAAAQGLGTGHGPAETSVVVDTRFERARASPDEVVAIRYDRRERLIAMGVITAPIGPNPFPGSADAGFVADPPAALR